MPKMSGDVLAERLRASHPDIRVLFVSGYAARNVMRRSLAVPRTAFLHKPLVPNELARKLRQLLDLPAQDQSDSRAADPGPLTDG